MTYTQLDTLQAGELISDLDGQRVYWYSGISIGGIYFFEEVQENEAEPTTLELTRTELIKSYMVI